MGTKPNFRRNTRSSNTPVKRSKGERLGWTSFKDVKPVDLNVVLKQGNVVHIDHKKPLLVP